MTNIGITCGDINGIGPEITLKSISRYKKDIKFFLIGPKSVYLNQLQNVNTEILNRIEFIDLGKVTQKIGEPTKISGAISLEAIKIALELWKEQKIEIIVTAPISKEAIKRAGSKFPGHTELFADHFDTKSYAMMFLSRKFFAALVTTHLPIKELSNNFSQDLVETKLKVVKNALIQDFRVRALKIAVLGFNPHSGENDTIGFEENKIIRPVINKLNLERKLFDGPFPSDAYFGQKLFRNYDCTIGMYHDQALIPFKLLNFNEGVNFTAGLPLIRTSPDHGTAFNLAGKNLANPSSLIEAIRFGLKILKKQEEMILSLENVNFSYSNQSILQNVNFNINTGDFVYLIGASGVGKTTLMRLIYMDILPTSGRIYVADIDSYKVSKKDISLLRRKLGIVFQNFRLLSDRTIYDNLAFVLHSIGIKNKELKKRVLFALSEVGLSHKRNSFPHQLSGGEQQRIAIARAMINNPVLILADEPTGNLDPETSEQIINLLRKINLSGTSVFIATHKYDTVPKGSSIIRLKDQTLTEVKDF